MRFSNTTVQHDDSPQAGRERAPWLSIPGHQAGRDGRVLSSASLRAFAQLARPIQVVRLQKGAQHTEAVRLVVAIRHVLGFQVRRTQQFFASFSVGGAWVKKCVEELRAGDPAVAVLHGRNRRRQSEFRLVGLFDRQNPLVSSGLADIEAGRVDIVVVYKIDRLSRSLMGFSKLAETFDRHKVSFVSVLTSLSLSTTGTGITIAKSCGGPW